MGPATAAVEWDRGAPAPLLSALAAGRSVIGTFVYLRDPAAVEVLAAAGLDFVIIDCEHTPRSATNVEDMIRAADACGIAALVRMPAADPSAIGLTLDSGAGGIVIPHYGRGPAPNQMMRFPPDGVRGACRTVRATRWGETAFTDYADATQRDTWLFGLIEEPAAIDDLERSLSQDRLDVIMVGPGDLALALGVPGQLRHPSVVAAIERVADIVRRHPNPPALAMHVGSPAEVERWSRAGVQIFVWGIDVTVMRAAFATLREQFDAACREKATPLWPATSPHEQPAAGG